MRDIIILSTWYRTLYLQSCFDALKNARGIEDKLLWVFQNLRSDADVMPAFQIIEKNSSRFPYFLATGESFSGWASAQRQSWKDAYEFGADKVYFFSDDVICTPDFFEWHDAVQADGDWFGSTAWRHPSGQSKPFDLEAYYQVEYPTEISMGVCVKHKNISVLLESSPDWSKIEKPIVMPYVQRCYHIGGFSSHLESVGENTGPAVDRLPNPIPDYGKQKVILK